MNSSSPRSSLCSSRKSGASVMRASLPYRDRREPSEKSRFGHTPRAVAPVGSSDDELPSPGRAAPASDHRAGHRRGGHPLVVVRRSRGRRPGRRGRRGAPGLRRGGGAHPVRALGDPRPSDPRGGRGVGGRRDLDRDARAAGCPGQPTSRTPRSASRPRTSTSSTRRFPPPSTCSSADSPTSSPWSRCADDGTFWAALSEQPEFPYGVTRGELGLRARFPVSELETPGNLNTTRVLRAAVDGPYGRLIVYVVHGSNPLHDTTFQQQRDFTERLIGDLRGRDRSGDPDGRHQHERPDAQLPDPRRVAPRRDAHERVAALDVPRRDLAGLPAADRLPVRPTRIGAGWAPTPTRSPAPTTTGSRRSSAPARRDRGPMRYRFSRSLRISRAAFAPGPPVTPPPGCAPEPARYSPSNDEPVPRLPEQRPPGEELIEARLAVVDVAAASGRTRSRGRPA